MKSFVYILTVFLLVGCSYTFEIKKKSMKPKTPEYTGIPIFYDWYEQNDSELDCESLKDRHYPARNDGLFRAIIRSLEFQGFNVSTMTEFVSDHDGIGVDDENSNEYIHLYYSCANLYNGIVVFTHKNMGKVREIQMQDKTLLGEVEDPQAFYAQSFGCLLNDECKPPKIEPLAKAKPKEPEPVESKPTEGMVCPGGKKACLEEEMIPAKSADNPEPVSEPDAKLDRGKFLELFNAYREEKSLKPVSYDKRLNKAAVAWAKYHKRKKLYPLEHDHGKSTPSKRMRKQKYKPSVAAENLARVRSIDPAYLLLRWKQSPGHNENLLEPDIRHIGLSCIYAPLKKRPTASPFICVLKLAAPKGKAKKKK